MTTGLNQVLDHLRRTLAPPDGGLTDGQLLARFIASRDEVSFATLVRRHGPMVWRLSLRLLGHVQDAEDAFQATFLVLACKAATVLKRESVGSFLYGVAYRTALKARAIHARRRSRERQVEEMPHPEIPPVEPQDWLDHELNLLSEKYRAVIVACDLEGRSRKETARQLGLSEGTVSSRIARGRRLLAKRLSRYGLSLSGGVLASALAEGAHVPASLLSSTTETAVLVATGQAAAVSGSVEVLMKGALKMMFLAKLKVAVGAVVVVTALGAVGLAYRVTAQQPKQSENAPLPTRTAESRSQAETRRPQADDLESLRLEIEALRKELRATKERVKALEAEVRGPKRAYQPLPQAANRRAQTKKADDPLAEAEAALKKLRERPDDKQAAEALERALKRLREREKPKQPGPGELKRS
jgi:RNA polymerase sigma factor (sigma-70 family)